MTSRFQPVSTPAPPIQEQPKEATFIIPNQQHL
jgi:hypothetical protein